MNKDETDIFVNALEGNILNNGNKQDLLSAELWSEMTPNEKLRLRRELEIFKQLSSIQIILVQILREIQDHG